MIGTIQQLADNGLTINQISRHLKTYDVKIRRIVKEFPKLEKKLFENGNRRKLIGIHK